MDTEAISDAVDRGDPINPPIKKLRGWDGWVERTLRCRIRCGAFEGLFSAKGIEDPAEYDRYTRPVQTDLCKRSIAVATVLGQLDLAGPPQG